MRIFLFGIAAVISACGSSASTDTKVVKTKTPGVQIGALWAQPITLARTSAAVYMTISPDCSSEDVLQSVEAAAPQKASLHMSGIANGALNMTPLKSISIVCDKPTSLKPMGMHVMVTNIQKPVGIGDLIPLTLHFERAGKIPVQAEITSMAVLEDVDPMNMNKHHSMPGGMKMDHTNGN